jgi:hypothetical protein
MKKKLVLCAATLAVGIVVAQFFQPEISNPPTDPAASFASVAKPPREVVAIVDRSCRDCHTNQTAWPWYSKISPLSWMIARDVKVGRARLNFSQWNIYSPEMSQIRMREACEEVRAGKMPLGLYLPLHPEAKLSAQDAAAFCAAAR